MSSVRFNTLSAIFRPVPRIVSSWYSGDEWTRLVNLVKQNMFKIQCAYFCDGHTQWRENCQWRQWEWKRSRRRERQYTRHRWRWARSYLTFFGSISLLSISFFRQQVSPVLLIFEVARSDNKFVKWIIKWSSKFNMLGKWGQSIAMIFYYHSLLMTVDNQAFPFCCGWWSRIKVHLYQ